MVKSPHEVQVEPSAILLHYSAAEAASFADRWLEVYGANRQGVNAKAYLWHIFAANRYPHIARDQARAQYELQEATAFVVLCNDRKHAFLTSQKPVRCSWIDYLVFPSNLAWTMARTHEEEWLGPYFARHPRFAELDAENRAAIRKQREAEIARSRGWAE